MQPLLKNKRIQSQISAGILTTSTIVFLQKYFNNNPHEAGYTINLMWINRALSEKQMYIFPTENETDLKEKYLNTIIKWSELNPNSIVHIWFDSSLTTEQAVQNTLEKIKELRCKICKKTPILLKDIREIPDVKNNAEVFSDKTPVYFRTDLLRIIASIHTLSTHKATHFVYADLDVKPLSEQELFDKKTLQDLEDYGIVVAKTDSGGLSYENSFHIINKHKPNLLQAIKLTLIDLNIKRAYNALNDNFYNTDRRRDYNSMRPLQQIVYDSYPPMFSYYYHLEKLGKLTTFRGEIYNYHQDGLELFGLDHLRLHALSFVLENEKLKDKSNSLKDVCDIGDIWIPTKKVDAPPASLNYS